MYHHHHHHHYSTSQAEASGHSSVQPPREATASHRQGARHLAHQAIDATANAATASSASTTLHTSPEYHHCISVTASPPRAPSTSPECSNAHNTTYVPCPPASQPTFVVRSSGGLSTSCTQTTAPLIELTFNLGPAFTNLFASLK